MSQACQIHPQALSDFELDLCLSLNWEVTKVGEGGPVRAGGRGVGRE